MIKIRTINFAKSCLILSLFVQVLHSQTINPKALVSEDRKEALITLAKEYLNEIPYTITHYPSPRSEGGIHDFHSEGDYWWPDPNNPEGPYIRKDGLSNPDNFNAHRKVLLRLNKITAILASAYLITGEDIYLNAIVPHFKAWFVTPETRMNPSLWYAQAISGRVSGRGIGIIDTVHLIEVVKVVEILMDHKHTLPSKDLSEIKAWFERYLYWMTTSSFGIAERDNGNNHSVTWAEQVAMIAHMLEDEKTLEFCRDFYKNTLLADQMALDGSFPLELERTKPYGYSIFVMDAMATLCQILSTKDHNLFTYTTLEGKSIGKGMAFLYPFLKDKGSWPYQQDVSYWDEWPVQQPSLLFTAIALGNENYLKLWTKLPDTYSHAEVIRNMPVKHPELWIYTDLAAHVSFHHKEHDPSG